MTKLVNIHTKSHQIYKTIHLQSKTVTNPTHCQNIYCFNNHIHGEKKKKTFSVKTMGQKDTAHLWGVHFVLQL